MAPTRLLVLCGVLVGAAYLLAFAAMRQPQPVAQVFTAAGMEGTPTTDPTQQAFRKAVLEWMAGTSTPAATATRPPNPTPTAVPRCTGALSPGRECVAATSAPTPAATLMVATFVPVPTWPGEAKETPGSLYVMPLALPTPPAMYWNLP